MLVRPEDDGALVIGQLSHSWLSGQLARAWGNPLFIAPEPREQVVLGAQQHDIGWALFDLEPRLNADSGLPRGFIELSVEEHLAIWRDAPDHLVSQSLHAALVVSMHGSSLSELRARAAQSERTRRQMWTWDGLSLALCLAWRPFTASSVPTSDGLIDVELRDLPGATMTLDPWPFAAERVEVHCEARRLPGRYEDEAAMRRAFAQAQPETLSFVLVPS
jgi:hypothetical protein